MKFHNISVFWLLLTLLFLAWVGSTAAEDVDLSRSFSSETNTESPTGDLQDLIAMATELDSRSIALKKEIDGLFDLNATQKSLALLANENKRLSRTLRTLKNTSRYSYDQLFEVKARINQQGALLREVIQTTNEGISQTELWKKEWAEEGTHWEQLQSSLAKQVSAKTLEPTFAKVRQVITRSQNLITQTLEPILAQLQAAEVIRASHAALGLELDALVSGLHENLLHKTARSMFSSRYYSLLSRGWSQELPRSLNRIAKPDLQFLEQRGWLLIFQIVLSLLLSYSIIQQRERLMEREQWRFIARRPLEAGIFVAAIATSLFYGAVPGTFRLLAQCVVILSLARLVGAFVENGNIRYLVYGLSIYLIITRLFGVFDLPFSLFRFYVFNTVLISLLLCLWGSAASSRRGDPRLYARALSLGALLCLVILIAEMGGYSTLSTQLLESSLKTIFVVLAGWILMVMLRGFIEWTLGSPPLKKIPFIKVKTPIIISRSAILANLLAVTLTGTFVLVAWRFYSNPAEAIQAVLSFGLTIGSQRISVGLILTAAAFLYCAFLTSWAVQAMLMEGVFTTRQLQIGVRISMARLVHYGFVFLGFVLALLTLGVQLRELTIIAGALGVGIGFGLQGIINNFVSGLILLFERPIKVGDYIELDGQQAEIKKIGLRATVVQTPERSEIVVPNSDLISNQVTNWTLSDQYAGIRISVGVACDADVPRVIQALLECAQEHTQVAEHPAPQALFRKFGESTLEFELRGWISEVDDWDRIRSELNQSINSKFRSLGIQIPFPQQDLHLHMAGKSVPAVLELVQNT